MAALSDKDPIVKYSWEDIKFTIGFEDKNGSPIDAETKKFKFIYKDEAGCCCEVSYDGKTRKNCVFRDGKLVNQAVGARPKAGVLALLG